MGILVHPTTQHSAEVGGLDVIATVFLGPLWYLARGLWGAGIILFFVTLACLLIFFPLVIVCYLVQVIAIIPLLQNKLEAAGYVEMSRKDHAVLKQAADLERAAKLDAARQTLAAHKQTPPPKN